MPGNNMARSEMKARLAALDEAVAAAALRSGRDPAGVTILAAAKTVSAELVEEAIELGVRHVGENRVQEASAKFEKIGKKATWHMVGHLQTNKVKRALEIFDVIQSVDSLRLAEAISERAVAAEREVDVLLEVNTSGEATKYGLAPAELRASVEQMCVLPGLRIRGLMTVGPLVENPDEAREAFVLLRRLGEQISLLGLPNVETHVLSMGMSGDFEVAIEEGATMIRVGTAIFGPRT
jgi:pyridoxal phosphate enzyme (YggS family)